MASAVAKFAAKKYLGDAMEKHKGKDACGDDDPFFAYETKNGRKRKVKKQIPDFIPEHDAKILAKAKKSAYRLDMALFNFAGIRFGWSSLIGLIPEVGDVIDAYMAYRLYQMCKEVDATLPSGIERKMMFNIVVDFLIGLVPFIGDLGDAAFKANTKNVALLEKHLIQSYKPSGMSPLDVKDSIYEEFDDQPHHHEPPPKRGGGGGRSKGRPDDVEMGNKQHTGKTKH